MNGAANVFAHDRERESDDSHSLSKCEDIRLHAADFNTGSHLVVGEFVSTDMPVGLEGAEDVLVTSPNIPDPTRDADNRKARRALIHARIGTLVSEHIGDDGMSEYPAPSISRDKGWLTLPVIVR